MSPDEEPPSEPWSPEQIAELRHVAQVAFAIILAVEALVVVIFMWVIPTQRPKRTASSLLRTMIVLGSGGHTAEMLRLVAALPKATYTPRFYVAATTDALSGHKAMEAEKQYQTDGQAKDCELYSIPRSREVGQSYITSVFTTLRSLLTAAAMVWELKPDVLLVNGPGTCIPLCLMAFMLRKLFIKHCDIVYVESIARVTSLSLSGKILYKLGLADVFLVQWPELQKRYPRATFVDRLY